jgi:Holliday junction endodeoxyribonuclease RuvC-like protein
MHNPQTGEERIRSSCYVSRMRGTAIRIIGIDPGLRRTGWGIVESDGVRLSYVGSGLLTSTADAELAYRLRELFEGIASIIASYKPQEAAVEETFVNENARATLKLGQARGMALLAPAMAGSSSPSTRRTSSRSRWSAQATRRSTRSAL